VNSLSSRIRVIRSDWVVGVGGMAWERWQGIVDRYNSIHLPVAVCESMSHGSFHWARSEEWISPCTSMDMDMETRDFRFPDREDGDGGARQYLVRLGSGEVDAEVLKSIAIRSVWYVPGYNHGNRCILVRTWDFL
jgi:hypothetical protein